MRRIAALTLAAVALLGLPSAAPAAPYDDVLAAFRAGGVVDPCAFTPEQLREARAGAPADVEQQAPGFVAALDTAIETGCVTPTTATAPADPAAGAVPPVTTATTATTAAADAREDDSGIVLLVVLAALLLLGLAAWGAMRWWAWEPPWLVRARHATAEAGWRLSAAWSEFTDWVRLGR